MGDRSAASVEQGYWRVPSLEEQADVAERYGVDTLLYCRDGWALRHKWVHVQSGEMQRARCNRWECLYCGPRKVDLWRQLVKQAEPTLFLTLTKAGKTVEEARRALTTCIQALRRGSKGKGPNRVGARLAYLVEYFGVLERHRDFERNGFHWHLLIKGVDFIDHEVLRALWMSATHYRPATGEDEGQGAKIVHIERIRNHRVIGYVTKYLTKAVSMGERGTRERTYERLVVIKDEEGRADRVEVRQEKVKVVSKAHRICYSRHFFPERVADLRKRLFAGMDQEAVEQSGGAEDVGKPLEQEEEAERRSPWRLVVCGGDVNEEAKVYEEQRRVEVLASLEAEYGEVDARQYEQLQAEAMASVMAEVREWKQARYRQRGRERLLEVLDDLNEGRCFLSRRVVSIWQYQRSELHAVG
jgi:hypothetical protein